MASSCSNTPLVWTISHHQSPSALNSREGRTVSSCTEILSSPQQDDYPHQADPRLQFSILPRLDLTASVHAWMDLYPAIRVARELSSLFESIRFKAGLGFNPKMVMFLRKIKNTFGVLVLGAALLQLKMHPKQIAKQSLALENRDRLLALCKKSACIVKIQILQHCQLDVCRGLREIRNKNICTTSVPKLVSEHVPSKTLQALVGNLETSNPPSLSAEEVYAIALTAQFALYDRDLFLRLGEINACGGVVPAAICYALHHHRPTISVLPYRNTNHDWTLKFPMKLHPKDQKRLIQATYPESLFLI